MKTSLNVDQICEGVSPDTCWKITGNSALVLSVIIDLCSHVRFSGGSANPKLSALSKKHGVPSRSESRM